MQVSLTFYMNKHLLWLAYFLPALAIETICWFFNPIVVLPCFVKKNIVTDRSKRLGGVVTIEREFLKGWFNLFSTHDNPVCEGWHGLYDIPFLKGKTQQDYDSSWLIRYWCRVWWLSRNTAYGWHYLLFSLPVGEGWQYKTKKHLFGNFYNDINIGWKRHKGKPRLLYANRVIGLRKYKE